MNECGEAPERGVSRHLQRDPGEGRARKRSLIQIVRVICAAPAHPLPLCWSSHDDVVGLVGRGCIESATGRIPSMYCTHQLCAHRWSSRIKFAFVSSLMSSSCV